MNTAAEARGWPALQQRLQRSWAGLSLREQRIVGLAALLLAVALLAGLGIWPAVQKLQRGQAEQQRLSQQLRDMQQLQARANLLKNSRQAALSAPAAPAATSPVNSEQALRQTLQPLGDTARVQVSDQRVQVTLSGADPTALTTWWAQARSQAKATAQEARLVRRQAGEQLLWDGQVVMGLPPP